MANININRKSLGRLASIGDLYDATKDSFCGQSIFLSSSDVEIEEIGDSYVHTNIVYNDESLFNNLIKYDLEPELAVSREGEGGLWLHFTFHFHKIFEKTLEIVWKYVRISMVYIN